MTGVREAGQASLFDGVGVVPCRSSLDGCFGYVYRIDHLPTGVCYIGKHLHRAGEDFGSYRGSGLEWLAFKRGRDWSEFSKSVLVYASSVEELAAAEKEAILSAWLAGEHLLNRLVVVEPEVAVGLFADGRLTVADLDRLGKGSVCSVVEHGRVRFEAEWEFKRGDGSRLRFKGGGRTREQALERRELSLRQWLAMRSAPSLF